MNGRNDYWWNGYEDRCDGVKWTDMRNTKAVLREAQAWAYDNGWSAADADIKAGREPRRRSWVSLVLGGYR